MHVSREIIIGSMIDLKITIKGSYMIIYSKAN